MRGNPVPRSPHARQIQGRAQAAQRRRRQGQGAAVQFGEIVDDVEAEAVAGGRLVEAAAAHHCRAEIGRR